MAERITLAAMRRQLITDAPRHITLSLTLPKTCVHARARHRSGANWSQRDARVRDEGRDECFVGADARVVDVTGGQYEPLPRMAKRHATLLGTVDACS